MTTTYTYDPNGIAYIGRDMHGCVICAVARDYPGVTKILVEWLRDGLKIETASNTYVRENLRTCPYGGEPPDDPEQMELF